MVDAAETRGLGLDTGGAIHAQRLVARKGARRIATASLEACRERDGVLDGESSALGEIGQNGMGGIAEKRHAPVRPAGQRLEPKERPAAPGLDRLQQGLGGLSPALEAWQQEIGFGAPAPALLGAAALDHGDDVQILAATHWVVDEMGVGPEPESDLRVGEWRRYLATR